MAGHCRAVYVDCDPGFPLTLRLQQAGSVALAGAGYPVIDTTHRVGLLCSRDTQITAVNRICWGLGYKHVTTNTIII